MAGVRRRNILFLKIRCYGERLQIREMHLWPFTNLSALVHPHCLPSQHCASSFNRHKYISTHTHKQMHYPHCANREISKQNIDPSSDFTSVLDEWVRHIAMWQQVHSHYNHLSCIYCGAPLCFVIDLQLLFLFLMLCTAEYILLWMHTYQYHNGLCLDYLFHNVTVI